MDESVRKVRLASDVTIGMAACGNSAGTKQALDCLSLSAEGNFELILVNDCSPDNTLSLFLETQKTYPHTKVISFDKNMEYSGSVNAILSHAAGKWVLFLSNDVLVTPGYLREIFKVAKLNDEFGIVRGCSNFVDGFVSSHNITVPDGITNVTALFDFAEKIAAQFGGEYLCDRYLTGDAFLISRHVLEKVGGLDPLFYGYFADQDLGIRSRIAGYKIVLARGAFALHMAGSNLAYLSEEERQKKLNIRWSRVYENWARFKLKYKMPVEEAYENINNVPWDELSAVRDDANKYYCRPGDYTRYFV